MIGSSGLPMYSYDSDMAALDRQERQREPAVEAADRAWDNWSWEDNQPVTDLAIAAASEALKPIRELHYRNEFGHCAQACIADMHGNTQAWPCDTAKLVYPESEIQ